MQHITTGKRVELAYEIYAAVPGQRQQLVFTFTADRPDTFIYGHEPGILQAFEQHIEGLSEGSTFDFTLQPDEAFGPANPELVLEVDRSVFVVDGEFDAEAVTVGAYVPMLSPEGHRVEGRVVAVTGNKVKLDFNHQLAGMAVRYRGTVKRIGDPAPEELQQRHHCCGHCGKDGTEKEDCQNDCGCGAENCACAGGC